MSDRINVAVTFKLAPDLLAQIEAVDPRVHVVDFPALNLRPGERLDDETRALAEAILADTHILFGPNSFPAELIDAAPALRWFQVINAGVDRMAEQGLLGRGFVVTNVSGLAAVPIAEWVMGAIIMLCKGFHQSVRDQAAHHWSFRFTSELRGKTIGIAGMGAIGRETARRARAFGMRIVATRRTVAPGDTDPDCDLLLPYSELAQLLAESDYVVLCVPLTAETQKLIGERELAKMKPSAALVNIARGAVVDQDALIAALRDGTIAGAALDVTDPEPLPPDNPLWDIANVIITPHVSGAVEGYGHRATDMFVQNLARYVRSEPLEHVVDPVLAY
ncbi:MAG: D-2-hydroxyacid dehydrogenase [Dehalococcoidia bacterium]|nr:D-2-hydroxyacid dehydrogenase [Dehalococcoidia bacterium]